MCSWVHLYKNLRCTSATSEKSYSGALFGLSRQIDSQPKTLVFEDFGLRLNNNIEKCETWTLASFVHLCKQRYDLHLKKVEGLMILIQQLFTAEHLMQSNRRPLFDTCKFVLQVLLSIQTSFDFVDTTLKEQTRSWANVFTMRR